MQNRWILSQVAGKGRPACPLRHSAFRIPHSAFSAFTLIEILLAIAILAVICGTIYQFTGTTVRATVVSAQADSREQALAGLRRLLEAQFASLPRSDPHAFLGATTDGKHGRRDALQMICPAGNAVLTPDARGLYQITLGLHEIPRGSGHYTLGLEREPWSDDLASINAADGFTTSAPRVVGGSLPSDWVRLLDGVSALEISYFDPRLNVWLDKWNDQTLIPSLVRMRLTMENGGAPYEFIEQVPGGGLRRGLPNTVAANVNIPGLPPGTVVPSLPNGFPAGAANSYAPQPGSVPKFTPPSLPPGIRVPPPPPNLPSGAVLMPETGPDLPPR